MPPKSPPIERVGSEIDPVSRCGRKPTPVQAPDSSGAPHPVLQAACDLIPLEESPTPHVRLHPVLANGDLRSRYLADPEVNIPRSLFSTSASSSSPASVRLEHPARFQNNASSTPETNDQHVSMFSRTLLAGLFMNEIDAEIAAQSELHHGHLLKDGEEHTVFGGHRRISAYASKDSEPAEVPSVRKLAAALQGEIEIAEKVQVELRKRVQNSKTSHQAKAMISSSNLRELAIAEANARVQAFRDTPEYASYQNNQDFVFSNPQRRNSAAKDRVASFRKTPAWTRYAADLALILEYGDTEDVEIITESYPRRDSSASRSLPIDRQVSSQRKPRAVGPWAQVWSSLGKNQVKQEMWD